MGQEDRNAVVQRLRREYREAKALLATLEAACVEISKSPAITTEKGYLMSTPTGRRLHDADYVKQVVARYRAARERKETLRKRLLDLGESAE